MLRALAKLAERAHQSEHAFVDAPVSGGPEGARGGSLSFMVGGQPEDVSRARPLLEAMGAKITTFGAPGSGQAAKACHNMICGITALGVCEAFALAEALGLDPGSFFELCKGAAAQSWILENRCPVPGPAPAAPSSNGYAPGFAARLMAKDLRLAQEAAASTGQSTAFRCDGGRALHRVFPSPVAVTSTSRRSIARSASVRSNASGRRAAQNSRESAIAIIRLGHGVQQARPHVFPVQRGAPAIRKDYSVHRDRIADRRARRIRRPEPRVL